MQQVHERTVGLLLSALTSVRPELHLTRSLSNGWGGSLTLQRRSLKAKEEEKRQPCQAEDEQDGVIYSFKKPKSN